MESVVLDQWKNSKVIPACDPLRDDQPGHTPMEPVYFVIDGRVRKVHLKLERANPTGSVKDRTAFALLQEVEERGRLRRDSIIIESTSGNLGVALAALCHARYYDFVAVVDARTTQENIARMRAFGAQVVLIEQPDKGGGYLLSRLEYVREVCLQSDRYVWTDQYSSESNPRIHYAMTGPEIYSQMNGKIDAIFVAVSTGGTLAGIGQFFREISPITRIIGVDAKGSVVFGTPPGPRKLTGIGSSRSSNFITRTLYDTSMHVDDAEAFAFCRALRATTSFFVGGSSGAVLSACADYLRVHPEVQHAVCLCPDGGENYLSSIFNDSWLRHHGFSTSARPGNIQEVLHTLTRYW